MRHVIRPEMRAVDSMNGCDKPLHLIARHRWFRFAIHPPDEQLKWERARTACGVDFLGRAKVRLMVVNGSRSDFQKPRLFIGEQTDPATWIEAVIIFHFAHERDWEIRLSPPSGKTARAENRSGPHPPRETCATPLRQHAEV